MRMSLIAYHSLAGLSPGNWHPFRVTAPTRNRLVMTLCALLLSAAGATLIYLASAQQRLLPTPLHPGSRVSALAMIITGFAAWLSAAGLGAGIAAALTSWMLTWVALPYVAWWRGVRRRAQASIR